MATPVPPPRPNVAPPRPPVPAANKPPSPAAPPRPPVASAPTPPVAPPAIVNEVAVTPTPVAVAPVAPVAQEAVAAPPVPVVSAAPTAPASEAAPKKRRGRQKGTTVATHKSAYHGLYVYNADGSPVYIEAGGEQIPKRQKLATVPTDYDSETHDKLRESDFASVSVFWEFKASEYGKLAAAASAKAAEFKKLGAVADNKNAQKLVKVLARQQALMAQLRAEGVDVDALMAMKPAPVAEVPAA